MSTLRAMINQQRKWSATRTKSFIRECLFSQTDGDTAIITANLVNRIYLCWDEKCLGDESIQYYVRCFLEVME